MALPVGTRVRLGDAWYCINAVCGRFYQMYDERDPNGGALLPAAFAESLETVAPPAATEGANNKGDGK